MISQILSISLLQHALACHSKGCWTNKLYLIASIILWQFYIVVSPYNTKNSFVQNFQRGILMSLSSLI
ncbi:hypothetical protein ES319_1Z062000v1 [Gossypium barbadense]|uniref:Uncharacterized protein n=1 Tax=Gossypium barbadense TaxID=3634 RepID=A0A5J5N8C1_GOSBA|nr:hypothetical protein ES319_1Z062000v1 [Gossypium barbadense]